VNIMEDFLVLIFLFLMKKLIIDVSNYALRITFWEVTVLTLLLLRIFVMMSHRSEWPRGLRRRSTAVRLLRSWFRIPPRAWMSVCCECCVLSGRGLCDEMITRPEESYRLWCVVCDLKKQNLVNEEAKTL